MADHLVISIIHGVEGDSVCLGDAPGSGTRTIKESWTVDRGALERALRLPAGTLAPPAEGSNAD